MMARAPRPSSMKATPSSNRSPSFLGIRVQGCQDQPGAQEAQGVSDSPACPQQRAAARRPLLGYQRGDRREVVRLQRVAHPEQDAEEPASEYLDHEGPLSCQVAYRDSRDHPAAVVAQGRPVAPYGLRPPSVRQVARDCSITRIHAYDSQGLVMGAWTSSPSPSGPASRPASGLGLPGPRRTRSGFELQPFTMPAPGRTKVYVFIGDSLAVGGGGPGAAAPPRHALRGAVDVRRRDLRGRLREDQHPVAVLRGRTWRRARP